MAIHDVFPEHYEEQLAQKISHLAHEFRSLAIPAIEVFRSPTSHYRMRAEFKMWQDDGRVDYAMHQPGEHKKPYIIDQFAVGSLRINELMPRLLAAINNSECLRRKLFQSEFLTTLNGEALITLIYHKPLDDKWLAAAQQLAADLNVNIVGRSRGQKTIIGQDYVTETLMVNGREFHYQQVEASFTQPNAIVCISMLEWALDATKHLADDLLELYCGNGNFTLPLATRFNKVLATEVSKTSVKSAQYNLVLNQIENVTIVRISSEEFAQAVDKEREFNRLRDVDLDSFNFSTIFVDPPRAGLDDHTVEIVKRFDNILYVSCNPETLLLNLQSICQTHNVERFAVFDQFPYTPHLECGVLLTRK